MRGSVGCRRGAAQEHKSTRAQEPTSPFHEYVRLPAQTYPSLHQFTQRKFTRNSYPHDSVRPAHGIRFTLNNTNTSRHFDRLAKASSVCSPPYPLETFEANTLKAVSDDFPSHDKRQCLINGHAWPSDREMPENWSRKEQQQQLVSQAAGLDS